jgi:hypothetical protein
MPKKPDDFAIGCEATAKGTVRLFFIRAGEAGDGVDLPIEVIGGLVTTLLNAGAKATELSGEKAGAARGKAKMPILSPTAIGLSGGQGSPMSLVVHSGSVRFGVALPPSPALRELGEKLIAASASEARSN